VRSRLPLLIWLALAAAGYAGPIDFKQRCVSSSRQFIVYSADARLRSRVASFAEELKTGVLQLLAAGDQKGYPIVITLDQASPAALDQPPMAFTFAQVETGFKVEIDVHIGEHPAEINLPRQIIRAVLLEYAYHDQPAAVRGGETFSEPPWWLIDGALQIIQKSDRGVDPEVFKRIIDTNKLPPLAQFLTGKPEGFGGSTMRAIDQACALCFVQALIDQPGGKQNLARFLQHLPAGNPDPVAALTRDFPTLASEQSLQKWWTLNLARFSAVDRYEGLSPEETEGELEALLLFELPIGKTGEKKTFGVNDFDEYLKLPASRAALLGSGGGLIALSTRANALYRTVIADYEEIFTLLAKGKTHGLKDRLNRAERYREAVLKRTSDVADFMNWFEATKMDGHNATFDGYLKAANELNTPPKRDDPISKYLDNITGEL
jgi:hypothetical protein